MKTTPEELWDAWSILRDYALADRNEELYQAIEKVERVLESIPGMIA